MFQFKELQSFLQKKLNITDEELKAYRDKERFKISVEKIKNVEVGNLYDNSNLIIDKNGIYYHLNGIRWKGFVYIKDGYKNPYYDRIINAPTYVPRFHIVECETIMSMKFSNKYKDRYVFSNVPVTMIDKIDGVEKELYICNNCLKIVNENKLNSYTTTKIFHELFLNSYSEEISTIRIFHNPLQTFNFLKNFRYDPHLKIFTHKTYDISCYKEIYEKPGLIDNFLNQYQTKVNPKTIALIRNFVPADIQPSLPIFNPFNNETIELTWKDERVKQKILKENKNPWGTPSQEMRISGISFPREIEKFKSLIEIRNDTKEYTFDKILDRFFEKNLRSFELKKCFIPLRTNIFIDLYNFFLGLEIIIEWIKKFKHISSKVSVHLTEGYSGGNLILKIFHENSVWQKIINKNNFLGGDIEELAKQLFCIADVTITAQDISNASYQIDLLKKDVSYLLREKNKDKDSFSLPEIIKLDTPIKGVIYKLIIYDPSQQ